MVQASGKDGFRPTWYHWVILALALLAVILGATGPLPPEALATVPTALGTVLEKATDFLASYGIHIAIALATLLAYLQRRLVLKIGLLAYRFGYVKPLAFLLRPAVHHILSHRPPGVATAAPRLNTADSEGGTLESDLGG